MLGNGTRLEVMVPSIGRQFKLPIPQAAQFIDAYLTVDQLCSCLQQNHIFSLLDAEVNYCCRHNFFFQFLRADSRCCICLPSVSILSERFKPKYSAPEFA